MASDPRELKPTPPGSIHGEADPETPTAALPKAMSALWYRLVGLPWRTLAVVAPGNAAGAWRVSQALVEVARERPRLLKAVNAVDASLGRLAAVTQALSPEKLQSAQERTRFIIAADSPLENPAAIGLLSTCDGEILLLERGTTRIPDGRRILELVGPERFLGAVLASR